MLQKIYTGNTVAFTAAPTVDGVPVDMRGEDKGRVGFIVKLNRTDPDEDAVINKEVIDGNFTIEASETDGIEPGPYYYEFRWFFNDAEFTLETGILHICRSVYN